MIVAARAVDGEGLEGVEGRRHHIVQFVHTRRLLHERILVEFGANGVPWTGDKEAGGGDHLRILGVEQIPSELFADELCIRLIAIEGVDDPVAVAPDVVLAAIGFAEANYIEPVASPAFAVLGRGE